MNSQAEQEKLLDKMKIRLFRQKGNAAFLAQLIHQTKIIWSDRIKTACYTGSQIWLNYEFIQNTPDLDTRVAVLAHELMHIARLHQFRRDHRDMRLWNAACDYRINNDLKMDGFSIGSIEGALLNEKWSNSDEWTEEKIYEELLKGNQEDGDPMEDTEAMKQMGESEGVPASGETEMEVAIKVQGAMKQTEMMGHRIGKDSGNLQEIISEALKTKIPWYSLLAGYLDDEVKEDWSWKRPNRRFDNYLPSVNTEETLSKANIWLDTSGSMSTEDIQVVVNTLIHLMSSYPGIQCKLWNFDIQITGCTEISQFNKDAIEITGRGGTDFREPVENMERHPDELHIVISDLYFETTQIPAAVRKLLFLVPKDHVKHAEYYRYRTWCYQ